MTAPGRVLLVASDADVLRVSEQALRELSALAVERASDVFEARRRCGLLKPDLIVIDLQLGDVALEIASVLARDIEAAIVFLCGADEPPPRAATVEGVACIDRPLTAAKLARTLPFVLQEDARTRRTPSGRPDPGHAAAKAELEARRLFRDEFLASMAHELRAPLQGVLGFACYMLDGRAGAVNADQTQCLEQISTGAEHVLQLVQDVLDLTDTEADTLHVRSEAVDPEQALREVMQVLQVIAIRRRVQITRRVDDRLGHVVSDATKIKQVLYNFVSNALKYTPSGGRVEISLSRDDADSFCIEVADTGPGIPADLLPGLFERSETRQGRGLFLTQRVVTALGGSVSARNLAAGGCVFRAHLPLAPSVVTHDPTQRLPRIAP